MKPTIYAPFLSLAALAACNSLNSPINNQPPAPTFTVIRAQGDSAALADTLNRFRAALGGALNAPNSPPATSGRREIRAIRFRSASTPFSDGASTTRAHPSGG